MQTREYSSIDDTAILSASMAVLQDMGYAVDEVEPERMRPICSRLLGQWRWTRCSVSSP
jgi:hypothetical protein